jgi:hypothetical protein
VHNITRNLEAEFNEADLLPKTKEAAIMATASYIAANAANDDEHMRHLRNLALEGVRVLQGTANQGHETMPRRNIQRVEQSRHPAAAPAIAPRTQVVEPLNGELRHGLAQNRVDLARSYVSNVSIIFDAPCLFLHHLLSISLHFMARLCIFWN